MYKTKINKVWSNGIPYEKSSKRDNIKVNDDIKEEETGGIKEEITTEINSVRQSLEVQLNSHGTLFSRNESGSRREDTYYKMAEREKQIQISRNPFLLNGNYITDLMNQDKYMKPKNSNFEK